MSSASPRLSASISPASSPLSRLKSRATSEQPGAEQQRRTRTTTRTQQQRRGRRAAPPPGNRHQAAGRGAAGGTGSHRSPARRGSRAAAGARAPAYRSAVPDRIGCADDPPWSVIRSVRLGHRGQPGERALATEQLHRLEQRRRDPSPGDRDPHRAERVARLQPELVDQRGAQRRLDRRACPTSSSAAHGVVRRLDDLAAGRRRAASPRRRGRRANDSSGTKRKPIMSTASAERRHPLVDQRRGGGQRLALVRA